MLKILWFCLEFRWEVSWYLRTGKHCPYSIRGFICLSNIVISISMLSYWRVAGFNQSVKGSIRLLIIQFDENIQSGFSRFNHKSSFNLANMLDSRQTNPDLGMSTKTGSQTVFMNSCEMAGSRSMGHGAWDEPTLDITVDTATPCQVQITAQRRICRGGHGKMWGVRVHGESA